MKHLLACVALVACAASAEANGFGFNRVNNRRVVVVRQPVAVNRVAVNRAVVVRQPVVVNRHVNFGGFNYGAAFAAPCQVNQFAATPCFGNNFGSAYGVNVGAGCFGGGFNSFNNFGYGAAFGSPVVLRNRFVGNRVVNPFFGFNRGFGLRPGFGF